MDIARTFEVAQADGATGECVVRLFDCRPTDDGRDWQVSFTISGIDPQYETSRAIYGVDAMQALLCAVMVVRAVLESSVAYREGRLTWLGSSDLGLGLEVASGRSVP